MFRKKGILKRLPNDYQNDHQKDMARPHKQPAILLLSLSRVECNVACILDRSPPLPNWILGSLMTGLFLARHGSSFASYYNIIH